jgi:CHAT domain-containing protein
MRFSPKRTQSVAVFITCAVAIILLFVFISDRIRQRVASDSADALLRRADDLAWNEQWFAAETLYAQAEAKYATEGNRTKALYAHVSQIPVRAESGSLEASIYALTQDLDNPEAANPETRLRILEVRGIIENNYDASLARQTWQEVASLATRQGHLLLAARALGEQGIAAFLLGDTATAKREVLTAWEVSRVFRDTAAHVRYASVYGAGLVELRRYDEALIALNEAINTAQEHPEVAYPTIAVSSKIDALRGLHRDQEALSLAGQAFAHLASPSLKGHYHQLFLSRSAVFEDLGLWDRALDDLSQALSLAKQLDYWRGITQSGGELAKAYEHQGDLKQGILAINEAIEANKRIPDELYFVPRNLAIKAEILAKLGQTSEAATLYKESVTIIESLLQHVPTRNVERMLLAEMGDVYSGLFVLNCSQRDYSSALHVLEEARGRIEAQDLQHHEFAAPHSPTPAEQHLTALNIALLNTSDPNERHALTRQIYDAELKLDHAPLASAAVTHPIALSQLQERLLPDELLVEYVLGNPHSYALAVTSGSVHSYQLLGRGKIEADSHDFRTSIRNQHANPKLGSALFNETLAAIPEFRKQTSIIIVPDGDLNFLPFGALTDDGMPLVATHTISTAPSATVFSILRSKPTSIRERRLPYVGVAAWVSEAKEENPVFRALSGPTGAALQPLPESKKEVETIAADLPKPSTILLGTDATETRFRELPLAEFNVLHLALHGYVDKEYPDRSALVFAPDQSAASDGMLKVRDIRTLHLNAKLVTLSACDTGVGPVGEDGVANIVNAFIEAGANSVVSTLWEIEDHSTEHLMAEFYARLARGESKGDALRDAQRQLIKEGYSPFYWASFELVGDPNGTI